MFRNNDLIDTVFTDKEKSIKEIEIEDDDDDEVDYEYQNLENEKNKNNVLNNKSEELRKEHSYQIEVDEHINFSNVIPINVLTVKEINNELYVLLNFEHYVTKNRKNGFFKSSLFCNFYPKMLIDFYEMNLEDNY